MINFTYYNPTQIHFGKDQIKNLTLLLKPWQGKNILLVYGMGSIVKQGIYQATLDLLKSLDIHVFEEKDVRANPSIESVISGRKTCLKHNIEFILAVGGGSVIDCAKAIAFSVTIEEDKIWDVFLRKSDAVSALPLGVVLTLAATGTESNGNTVMTNDETMEKRSVAYSFLFPLFAVIDPTYTMSVNKHYTLAGCIDIMMHVFEQFFSITKRTETSDYMCTGIIKSVIENTNRYLQGDESYETRANISWAATIGLNWILQQGKIGDWATHRLSYPITQYYGTTHGFALTIIHTAWLKITTHYNPDVMIPKLTFLGKELFNHTDPFKTIEDLRTLFISWKAPTSFIEANIPSSDEIIAKFAKNAIALGDVGSILRIDELKAKELFHLANH